MTGKVRVAVNGYGVIGKQAATEEYREVGFKGSEEPTA